MISHFSRSVLVVLALIHEGKPFIGGVWKATTLMRCLLSSDTTLSDLTRYAPGGNISDNMLCFLKCVLEGYEVLENGKIVPGKFEGSSILPSVPQDLSQSLEGCLDEIREEVRVVECRDLILAKDCLEEFYMGYQKK